MKPTPTSSAAKRLPLLLKDVRACALCAAHLPQGPRPVLQVDASARILIAGQAPGSKGPALQARIRSLVARG